MNILWHSNASWATSGYGTQTRRWTKLLKEAGHNIVVSTYWGLEGSILADLNGIIHLPRGREKFGNDIIDGHFAYAQTFYENQQPTDLVITYHDPFVLQPQIWGKLPWLAWIPIDSEPVMQEDRAALSVCRWPMAMSKYGLGQLETIGLDPLYCPLMVDTDVFKPMDRALARQKMQALTSGRIIPEDAFLVTIVGANSLTRRKNFSGMFQAFALFAAAHPEALLYVHSEAAGVWGDPLSSMAAQLDIADKVIFPPSYAMVAGLINDEMLNWVYNAADVKLMLSKGEGFGLTDLEAQAVGLPCIMTGFSSSVELCFTGWQIKGAMVSDQALTWWMLPDPVEAANALEAAYQVWKDGDMSSLRERTRAAAQPYSAQNVLKDYMLPALAVVQDELRRGVSRAVSRVEELPQPKPFSAVDR